MLNIDDFIKRLELLLDYYSISASVFADKVGVQRSGMSHLLSGRNKPSLDFVLKIVENFPEVDLYWLLEGSGEFPKKERSAQQTVPPITELPPAPVQIKTEVAAAMPDLFSAAQEPPAENNTEERVVAGATQSNTINNDEIERIVIFYKSGVFKNYNPGN